MRVLVCDDHGDARDLLGDMLELHGYQVVSTGSGEEALDHLLSSSIDIGLIDLGLPGLDGYGVARAVEATLGAARPRLIALTGFGQAAHRAAALAAGFDEHLLKPASIEIIVRAIRQQLES